MKQWILILCFSVFSQTLRAQAEPPINEVEYFIDADTGTGNGKSIPIPTADTIRLNSLSISTTGLTQGMHTLYIRARNNNGWGLFDSYPFYISAINPMPKIVAAEYFFSNQKDPGPGNAIPLKISPAADTVITSYYAPIPCGNADSEYHLYLRVKDEQGHWSHFESDTYKVRGANTVITVKAGLWSDASTWSNNQVPNANTLIVLNHSITVDINATCKYLYTFCHAVNVNNGKTLTVTGTLK